jgi:hypothetical protein
LTKQFTRSKSVCCEFAMVGEAVSDVFTLRGSSGNYTLALKSDASTLTPAEVLYEPTPGQSIDRVLTPLPAPHSWTRIRVVANLPPTGKGTLAVYYDDPSGAFAGGFVKSDLGQTDIDLGFDTLQIGILSSNEMSPADIHIDDVGCTVR